MKIYLVRHGESAAADLDDERPLTDKGKEDIKRLAHFIAPLKLQVSYIFQSVKLRTHQTAKILASAISVTKGIESKIQLEPLAPTDAIEYEILQLREDVVIVGHMPFLGVLVSKWVTGNENADIVLFKPGTMVCLENINSDQWIIRWVLNPEVLSLK